MKTIQARYSAKWINRITNIKAFTLSNGFCGEQCGIDALLFAIDKLGCNLQINSTQTAGRLRRHDNCWYEFEVQQ